MVGTLSYSDLWVIIVRSTAFTASGLNNSRPEPQLEVKIQGSIQVIASPVVSL